MSLHFFSCRSPKHQIDRSIEDIILVCYHNRFFMGSIFNIIINNNYQIVTSFCLLKKANEDLIGECLDEYNG